MNHASAALRQIAAVLTVALCLSCALPTALAGEPKVAQGVAMGMDKEEVKRLLRAQSGKENLSILEDIAAIPLGLDFHAGASADSRETGVTMMQAEGFQPLYFHEGKLFGVKQGKAPRDKLAGLKREFPTGSVFWHKFPEDKHAVAVFEGENDRYYGFTNRHGNFIVYDNPTRLRIMAKVHGSYCWLAKRFSPNLPTFLPSYLQCLRERGADEATLAEDAASCAQYCANTPEAFASDSCQATCRAAHEQGLRAAAAAPGGADSESPPLPRVVVDVADPDPRLQARADGFVGKFLLAGQSDDPDGVKDSYAGSVEYYDRGRLSQDEVLRDKQDYYARWPRRSFALEGRVVVMGTTDPGVKQFAFFYDFCVDNPAEGRRIDGKARMELLVDVTHPAPLILREDGEVLQRNNTGL